MGTEAASRGEKIKIKVEQHTFTFRRTWCAAWLFTTGFLHLGFLESAARHRLVARTISARISARLRGDLMEWRFTLLEGTAGDSEPQEIGRIVAKMVPKLN
jgi:hypothetical protein